MTKLSEQLPDDITLEECIASGRHLMSCDDDGYCNFCGEPADHVEPETDLDAFLDRALTASDLLQAYVDVAVDNLERLSDGERDDLRESIARRQPDSPDLAGALAILAFLLEDWPNEGDEG